jgi:hypothetical protein
MKLRRATTTLLAVVSLVTASAQELWTSADLDYGITKKLKADVGIECRTTDQLSNISRFAVSAGLNYRLCKYVKAGVAYTFLYDHNGNKYDDDDNYIPYYWQPRHRIEAELTGSYKIGRVTLSLRETYQYTYHRERVTTANYDMLSNTWTLVQCVNAKPKNYLRSRIMAEYNIRKSPFTPFASCEIYSDVSDFSTNKARYTVGSEYKLNSRNELSLFYRYIDRHNGGTHVIGVGYSFKLK